MYCAPSHPCEKPPQPTPAGTEAEQEGTRVSVGTGVLLPRASCSPHSPPRCPQVHGYTQKPFAGGDSGDLEVTERGLEKRGVAQSPARQLSHALPAMREESEPWTLSPLAA